MQKDFRGFIWYRTFRDNLTNMGVFFAILLGCGGLLSESSKGSALFTLSLPVTRRQLLGARTGTGLAQLLRDRDGAAARHSDPRAVDRPAIQRRRRARARHLPLRSSRAVFFSLASFLSTLFADIWRPLLIAIGHRVRARVRIVRRAAARHLQRDERRVVLQDGIAAVGGIPDKRGDSDGVAIQRCGNT